MDYTLLGGRHVITCKQWGGFRAGRGRETALWCTQGQGSDLTDAAAARKGFIHHGAETLKTNALRSLAACC